MKKLILVIVFFYSVNAVGQNRNSVWCFGDSAGIDFSSGIAQPISSGIVGRGSCSSIADENGNLLFYAGTSATLPVYGGFIYDSNHSVMLNGDSIFGQAWYQELVIVPIRQMTVPFTYFLLVYQVHMD